MATRVDHGLEVSLGVALKTWGREALLLLYRDRFSKAHPNKSPYEILMQKSAGKFFLNKNKAQAQAIEKNEVHKFDISALHLLLRNACNLSNAPRRWKDLKTLEGNIEKLKELRNMEAHWTEEVYSKENLEEKWVELVKAITVILKEGGFEVWLPIFKENLQSIKQGEIYDDENVVLQSAGCWKRRPTPSARLLAFESQRRSRERATKSTCSSLEQKQKKRKEAEEEAGVEDEVSRS